MLRVGLENIRGINLPTLMTSNGSTYSQSVRSCIPIRNRDPPLITGSVFELVSAYGTVGLSLGIPDVGHIHAYLAFIIFADRHFSKTILCLENLTL
jgi:hypothetical protein